MKKAMWFMLMLVSILALPAMAFAQGTATTWETDWSVLILTWSASLYAFASAIVFLNEIVTRSLKANGTWSWILSIVVGQALGWLAFLLKLGMFVGLVNPWAISLLAFGGTLFANGIFSMDEIKMLLEKLGIRVPSTYPALTPAGTTVTISRVVKP